MTAEQFKTTIAETRAGIAQHKANLERIALEINALTQTPEVEQLRASVAFERDKLAELSEKLDNLAVKEIR